MADPPAAELRTRFIKKPEQKQQMLLLLALALKVARYNSQITINEAEKSTTAAATIHRILLRCHHLHLMFSCFSASGAEVALIAVGATTAP